MGKNSAAGSCMNRFMTGIYNTFCNQKFLREFRDDFFGIEISQIASEQDLNTIKKISEQKNIKIGIHFPLRPHQWRLRDPLYLSAGSVVRKESYNYMEREFMFSRRMNPHYILIHYPKPVILDNSSDWSQWRFQNNDDFYFNVPYDFKKFAELTETFFCWYAQKAAEYNVCPIIEIDVVNQYLYATDLLKNMLTQYPSVKLCLDIGRIHLQDKTDFHFNGYEFVEKFSAYAQLIHLWNVRLESNLNNSHFPVLPDQNPQDGWADIAHYIKIISRHNSDFKVLFEHKAELINDTQLESCYNWVWNMLQSYNKKTY